MARPPKHAPPEVFASAPASRAAPIPAAPPEPSEEAQEEGSLLEDLLDDERDVADPREIAASAFEHAAEAFRDPHMGRGERTRKSPPVGPIAYFPGAAEQQRWRVEREDVNTGRLVNVATVPRDCTAGELVQRCLRIMPPEGSTQVLTLHLTPIDATGRPLSSGPYTTVVFDANSEEVVRAREIEAENGGGGFGGAWGGARGGAGGGGASDGVVQVLGAQLSALNAQMREIEAMRQAERDRLEQERADLLQKRLDAANMVATDISDAYRQVQTVQMEAARKSNETTTSALGDLLKHQQLLAEQDRDRRVREAAEERERLRLERQEERERARQEHELRVLAMKQEMEERKIAMELAIKERELAMREREMARAAERLEEVRRQEAAAARDAEIARQERERYREHQAAMASLQQQVIAQQTASLEAERERAREHQALVIATLEKQNPQTKGLGVVGEVLDMLGMTPKDVVEQGKALLGASGGGGIGVAIVEGFTSIAKEVVKRLPTADEEEDDEEDDDDGEDEDGTVQQVPAAQPKAITQAPTQVDPLARVESRSKVPVEAEAPQAPQVHVPIEEAKAGRAAVLKLVDALEDKDLTTWPGIVTEHAAEGPVLDYINKIGVQRALADAGASEKAVPLQQVLTNLGLYTWKAS